MKNKITRFFKYSLFTFLFCIFFSVIYILYIYLQLPLNKLSQYSYQIDQKTKIPVTKDKVSLEEGAIINKEELKSYFTFSTKKIDFNAWFQNRISLNELSFLDKRKNLIFINKDQDLDNLGPNHCSKVYCYQYRMSFDHIPAIFWKGLIGIEDLRFLNHFGVDFISIARALITDIRKLRLVQGGSTLTQQLVKNLFFSSEKTFTRKIKEIVLSVYAETMLTKEQILEAYFNEVFWGSLQGIHIKGLFAASLFYFETRPKSITPYQASILISMLKGPGHYHPIRNLDRLKMRTNLIFKKLGELNFFSGKKDNIWTDQQWRRWQKRLIQRNNLKHYASLESISRSSEYQILNSYESFVFNVASKKIMAKIKKIIGEKDISVKAFISSPLDELKSKTYSFYSKRERNQHNAIFKEKHQVGSTLKPVLYDIFTKYDKSFSDYVSTLPITLHLKSGKWTPREAHSIAEKEVTLIDALLKSYNNPVIRLSNDIGFEKIEESLVKYIPSLNLPLSEYPSQLLGAVELSVFDLNNIYSALIHKECERINSLSEKDKENIEELSLLFLLANPKKTTVRRVVSKRMSNMQFFGKTGTSNNGLDNWYVFFDGQILGTIWVGLEGNRQNEKLRLFGSTTAFSIYQYFAQNRGKRFYELSCSGPESRP